MLNVNSIKRKVLDNFHVKIKNLYENIFYIAISSWQKEFFCYNDLQKGNGKG